MENMYLIKERAEPIQGKYYIIPFQNLRKPAFKKKRKLRYQKYRFYKKGSKVFTQDDQVDNPADSAITKPINQQHYQRLQFNRYNPTLRPAITFTDTPSYRKRRYWRKNTRRFIIGQERESDEDHADDQDQESIRVTYDGIKKAGKKQINHHRLARKNKARNKRYQKKIHFREKLKEIRNRSFEENIDAGVKQVIKAFTSFIAYAFGAIKTMFSPIILLCLLLMVLLSFCGSLLSIVPPIVSGYQIRIYSALALHYSDLIAEDAIEKDLSPTSFDPHHLIAYLRLVNDDLTVNETTKKQIQDLFELSKANPDLSLYELCQQKIKEIFPMPENDRVHIIV